VSDLFNAKVQSFQQYHGDLILVPELGNTILNRISKFIC